MNLIAYKRATEICLGDLLPEGRIVPILDLPDAPGNLELLQRIAKSYNACDGLSDKLLDYLAGPQNTVSVAERIVGWNLLVSNSRAVASRMLTQAREIIKRQGGKA